eukprot:2074-Lingulodinium_polyedra.AAC.1
MRRGIQPHSKTVPRSNRTASKLGTVTVTVHARTGPRGGLLLIVMPSVSNLDHTTAHCYHLVTKTTGAANSPSCHA